MELVSLMHASLVKISVLTLNKASKSPLKIIIHSPTLSSLHSPLYPPIPGAALQHQHRIANTPISFTVPSPQLWSPQKPNLYHFEVELGQDVVWSYLGFRTIEKKKDSQGVVRPFLNGEFVFQFGTLDQGFWPDGLQSGHSLGLHRFIDTFALFCCHDRSPHPSNFGSDGI
jgi:hypothetical protein